MRDQYIINEKIYRKHTHTHTCHSSALMGRQKVSFFQRLDKLNEIVQPGSKKFIVFAMHIRRLSVLLGLCRYFQQRNKA